MSEKRSAFFSKDFDVGSCKPLGDAIIAEPWENHTEIGGIIIPEQCKKQKTKSVVKAVGPRCKKVKPGDVIFHSEYAGSPAAINQKEYIVMHEDNMRGDLYGIYTGEGQTDIQPFADKILLLWEEGLQAYSGTGILRATGTMERHYTGIIVAVGEDVVDVKVGDRVFFDQFCGPERIDSDNKRYAFIRKDDLLLKLALRTEMEVLSA